MAKLKLKWEEFNELAMSKLREEYHISKDSKPEFVIDNSYEGESESYSNPHYVYIELTDPQLLTQEKA